MRKLVSLLLGFLAIAGADAQTKPPVLPVWASGATPTNDIVQPSNAFITQGWPLSSTPPARQYFNWLENYTFNGIRYFSHRGIVDWDTAETYQANDIVQFGGTSTSAGLIVRSSHNNNTGNQPTLSVTDPNWQPILSITPANGDRSSEVTTTSWVGSNFIPIGCAFNCIAGSIAPAQTPLAAVQQYQGNLSIGFGQLTGVPLDTNPSGGTIVQRNSAGQIFAQFFNQVSGGNENPPIGQVIVNNQADTYNRKASFLNFQNQENLALLGGQIGPAQIQQSAVTQFSPAIFAFNPLVSKTQIGYTEIPGGIIEEWGVVSVANNTNQVVDIPITFPFTFPNACFVVIPVTTRSVAANGQAASGSNFATGINKAGATISCDSSGVGVTTCRWFAIGF